MFALHDNVVKQFIVTLVLNTQANLVDMPLCTDSYIRDVSHVNGEVTTCHHDHHPAH